MGLDGRRRCSLIAPARREPRLLLPPSLPLLLLGTPSCSSHRDTPLLLLLHLTSTRSPTAPSSSSPMKGVGTVQQRRRASSFGLGVSCC